MKLSSSVYRPWNATLHFAAAAVVHLGRWLAGENVCSACVWRQPARGRPPKLVFNRSTVA
jgi:hypothetical protein